MPLLEHFSELRRRLVIVIVSILVAAIVIYFFSSDLIRFLIDPISEYLPGWGRHELNVLNPLGGFSLRFKVSLVAGVMVTAPIWIWNLLAFFVPALKPNERKWVLPTFFVGLALFIVGNVFCYFIILDPAFEWMLAQTAEFATILPDAYSYVNVILMFELSFGIVPYKKFRKQWRIIYIVLMVVCAFVTPDASPVTMMLLFAAMISLYEVSLALAKLVLRKKIARQQELEAAEAEEG